MIYIDSSAAFKLLAPEAESSALMDFIATEGGQLVASELLATELYRAASRAGVPAGDVTSFLAEISIVSVDSGVLRLAGSLGPPPLRTLDAIHLATALMLGDAIKGMLCYDQRLASAAVDKGIDCRAPS